VRVPPTRHARITALGEHRPAGSLTNHDLAARGLDTSDEWIRTRTGITARHVAGADETVVSMGAEAAAKALAAAGLTATDVDLLVLATCTIRNPIPGGAARIATALGGDGMGAFDVNAACGGFCYALSVAADAVRCGSATRVLVVGSEKLTDWLDWDDRGTCILFGDGAAAAVVEASDEPGIGPVAWGSDGDQHNAIEIAAGSSTMTMAGQAVYRWATTKLTETLEQAMEEAGVGPKDIDVFAPHQANLRIIESMTKRLGFPETTVIARDIVQSGNTSAASVPLALTALIESGEAKSGDLALVLGYGAGLTFAGQVLVLP
jgi:3-oxoacyl-[acyl-carrier-protein] synthase-3